MFGFRFRAGSGGVRRLADLVAEFRSSFRDERLGSAEPVDNMTASPFENQFIIHHPPLSLKYFLCQPILTICFTYVHGSLEQPQRHGCFVLASSHPRPCVFV